MQTVTELYNATVHGIGPKVISQEPMVRKQGNGNFTGFIRTTYENGESVDAMFVMNARSHAEVVEAYANRGAF